jgi:hypothetical protein
MINYVTVFLFAVYYITLTLFDSVLAIVNIA